MSARTHPLLLALAVVGCGGPSPSPLPTPAATRDGRWLQDVEYLAAELPRLHPNLFFRTPRGEYDRVVDEVRRAVPGASDQENIVGLMRIASAPGDPHTTVYAWEEFPKLPLRVTRLSGGLYVTSAEAPLAYALGAKILAFDASSVDEVEAAVVRVVSHQNTAWLHAMLPRYLILPAVLHALRVTSDPTALTLMLEDGAGARFTVRVPGRATSPAMVDVTAASGAALPLYRQRTQENYWSTLLQDSRTLYVQYNRCQQGPEAFDAFARRLFQQLDQGGADRLVVDLRLNEGGDSRVVDPLVDGLRDRSRWRASGRLFAIVGELTFSSGLMAADELRRLGAVLVGEPTGGTPNHYGNVRTFTLPNSRLRVGHSTQFYRLDDRADPPSLYPDVAAPPSIADLAAGRDPALDATIRFPGR